MGTVIEVPDGEASMGVYLVKYDEDQWFRYDEAGHQFCYDTWIRKATPIGVRLVVLQLVPDAIFPRDPAKPLPYVAWEHRIEREVERGFKLDAFISVQIETDEMDVPLRHRVETALREFPTGTGFEVLDRLNNTILSGKVSK